MKTERTSLRVRNERGNLLRKLGDCFSAIAMTIVMALMPLLSLAQDVEMADTMRSNGKIYVVVGVIAIIFVGLVVYLFRIDIRLTKMEKEEVSRGTPTVQPEKRPGKVKFKANIELDVDESEEK